MASETRLFYNGRIFTPTASSSSLTAPFVDSMIIHKDKISYIGPSTSTAYSDAYNSASVTKHNLQGQVLLPAFIDSHMHFLLLGQSLQKLSLEGCASLAEIRARISQYAKQHPNKPRILCRGWMHTMTYGEARADMLDDLDVQGRPVFIDSKDLHSTWCNSAALDELRVQSMSDPAGGTIHRDASGRASGLLSEAAVLTLIWPHIATVASMEEKLTALRGAIRAYHEVGYTGVIDMAMDENGWEALQVLRDRNELNIRLSAYWLITPSDSEEARLAQVDRAIALNKQFNKSTSPDCKLVGIKIICDGVIDACTAALTKPYSTNGLSTQPLWTEAMLHPVIQRAEQAGLQCALHAIGDLAIQRAVAVLSTCAPGHRHRIEHLELASPEDAKRLGELGITASVQPVHADPAILRAWPALLGEERLARAFAYSEFRDGGAVLALGSDAPTAPFAPFKNVYTATTRRSAREPECEEVVNEEFRLGLCEAVTAATAGAAYSVFEEERIGGLREGMCADFVVVEMQWEAARLLEAKVKETWFGGRRVYAAG